MSRRILQCTNTFTMFIGFTLPTMLNTVLNSESSGLKDLKGFRSVEIQDTWSWGLSGNAKKHKRIMALKLTWSTKQAGIAFLFTPLIKVLRAINSINFLTLSIFSLNLFKYTRVDSSSTWVTLKSFVKLLLAGILVLNYVTTLKQRSSKLIIAILENKFQAALYVLYVFLWVSKIIILIQVHLGRNIIIGYTSIQHSSWQ